MPLSKLDQKKFLFFRQATAAGASQSYSNNCYGNMTLEISGDISSISLKVQGCINVEDAEKNIIDDANLDWTNLAVIADKDFAVSEAITAKGIYNVGIIGLARIRIVIESLSGEATVIGVLEG